MSDRVKITMWNTPPDPGAGRHLLGDFEVDARAVPHQGERMRICAPGSPLHGSWFANKVFHEYEGGLYTVSVHAWCIGGQKPWPLITDRLAELEDQIESLKDELAWARVEGFRRGLDDAASFIADHARSGGGGLDLAAIKDIDPPPEWRPAEDDDV